MVTWWALIASLMVVATAAGNVLVCLAITWERRLQNMTNYFLMSLAITDLMVAILVMPLGILTLVIGSFPLEPVYCLTWISLDVLFCTASIMHLCTISVDRYLSLRYPMKFGRNKTRRRVVLKIAFVWLLSIAMCLPLSLRYSKDYNLVLVKGVCQIPDPVYKLIGSIVSFYIPLGVMLINYALTVRLLAVQQQNLGDASCQWLNTPTIDRDSTRRCTWRRFFPRSSATANSSSTSTRLGGGGGSCTPSMPHHSSAETEMSALALEQHDLWLPDTEPPPPSTFSALHHFGTELLKLSRGLESMPPKPPADSQRSQEMHCSQSLDNSGPPMPEDLKEEKDAINLFTSGSLPRGIRRNLKTNSLRLVRKGACRRRIRASTIHVDNPRRSSSKRTSIEIRKMVTSYHGPSNRWGTSDSSSPDDGKETEGEKDGISNDEGEKDGDRNGRRKDEGIGYRLLEGDNHQMPYQNDEYHKEYGQHCENARNFQNNDGKHGRCDQNFEDDEGLPGNREEHRINDGKHEDNGGKHDGYQENASKHQRNDEQHQDNVRKHQRHDDGYQENAIKHRRNDDKHQKNYIEHRKDNDEHQQNDIKHRKDDDDDDEHQQNDKRHRKNDEHQQNVGEHDWCQPQNLRHHDQRNDQVHEGNDNDQNHESSVHCHKMDDHHLGSIHHDLGFHHHYHLDDGKNVLSGVRHHKNDAQRHHTTVHHHHIDDEENVLSGVRHHKNDAQRHHTTVHHHFNGKHHKNGDLHHFQHHHWRRRHSHPHEDPPTKLNHTRRYSSSSCCRYVKTDICDDPACTLPKLEDDQELCDGSRCDVSRCCGDLPGCDGHSGTGTECDITGKCVISESASCNQRFPHASGGECVVSEVRMGDRTSIVDRNDVNQEENSDGDRKHLPSPKNDTVSETNNVERHSMMLLPPPCRCPYFGDVETDKKISPNRTNDVVIVTTSTILPPHKSPLRRRSKQYTLKTATSESDDTASTASTPLHHTPRSHRSSSTVTLGSVKRKDININEMTSSRTDAVVTWEPPHFGGQTSSRNQDGVSTVVTWETPQFGHRRGSSFGSTGTARTMIMSANATPTDSRKGFANPLRRAVTLKMPKHNGHIYATADLSRVSSTSTLASKNSKIRGPYSRNSSILFRTSSRHGRIIRLEQKATKVLGVVFFTFVILWAPFFILNLLPSICGDCEKDIGKGVFDFATWLGYASSMVNPIFYTIFNKVFRQAFKKVLLCKYHRKETWKPTKPSK